jgi:hypothetical protein
MTNVPADKRSTGRWQAARRKASELSLNLPEAASGAHVYIATDGLRHKPVTLLRAFVRVAERAGTKVKLLVALVFALLVCQAAHSAEDEVVPQFTTSDGTTYHDVTITARDANGVRITHRDGAATIPWRLIPAETRQKLGYTPPIVATPAPAQLARPTNRDQMEAGRAHAAKFDFLIPGAAEADVRERFKLYPKKAVHGSPAGLAALAVTTEGPDLEFRFLAGKCVSYRLSGIKETEDAFAILKKYSEGQEWEKVSDRKGNDEFFGDYHSTTVYHRPDRALIATVYMRIPKGAAHLSSFDVTLETPAYLEHLAAEKEKQRKARDVGAQERTKNF